MTHPYREPEGPKRGPLTKGEKLRLGLRGILKMEPLLEQHRFGLDPENGLPIDERARHAAEIARSDSTDNIFQMIRKEPEPGIKEMLWNGYRAAFKRRLEEMDHFIHIESGMAGRSCHSRIEEFKRNSAGQVKDLMGERHVGLESGKQFLKQLGDWL